MVASKAQAAWDELNERQRTYLRAFLDEDQGLEEEHRHLGATGRWGKAPARVWRRIHLTGRYAPTPRRLRSAGVWESGAGSTLAALADRGLIELGTNPASGLYALLTRAGRAAARAGLGIAPATRKEPWELSKWLWREMAKVARAGEQGLPAEELFGSAHLYLDAAHAHRRGNRPYLHSHRSFITYTPRDYYGNPYPYTSSKTVHHYRLTEQGRAHYTDHLQAYREFYPDIAAPDIAPTADTPVQ
ncbi:hypothetical protein [Kitasatospora kifunensis]|uniref:Uncharacterized protein n=1 Tax=Kitasatospora kifunensis TaxID=58351 RepID=A0A7W7RD05_KITKI|nr:hypothetical protein [Kitasatospora kifunensis]MBB4929111.1 hypothetical protein [Kitasatospora kifunensis]